MKKAGLEKSYTDLKLIPDYFEALGGTTSAFNVLNPHMLGLYIQNIRMVKAMRENNVFNDAIEEKPSAILSFGNINLATRINREIKENLELMDLLAPPMIHFDRTIMNYTHEVTNYVDYCMYDLNRDRGQDHLYKFPGICTGNSGVFRAFKFLYSKSKSYNDYIGENYILLNLEWNKDIMESLVTIERENFRKEHGISETCTVIFLAPGLQEHEFSWSINLLKESIAAFKNKPSVSESFANSEELAICVATEGNPDAKEIAQKLKSLGNKVIIAENEEQKFSAMAVKSLI